MHINNRVLVVFLEFDMKIIDDSTDGTGQLNRIDLRLKFVKVVEFELPCLFAYMGWLLLRNSTEVQSLVR